MVRRFAGGVLFACAAALVLADEGNGVWLLACIVALIALSALANPQRTEAAIKDVDEPGMVEVLADLGGGCLSIILSLGLWLVGLYALVRFVKWGWEQ